MIEWIRAFLINALLKFIQISFSLWRDTKIGAIKNVTSAFYEILSCNYNYGVFYNHGLHVI